jgi:predicted Na+-dependent transporter
MALHNHVPYPRTWTIFEIVVKIMLPIVIGNVLNKNHGNWLLGDALQFVIIKIHEFCNYVVDVVVLDNMANPKANVCDVKLEKLTIHMKRQMLNLFNLSSLLWMGLIRKGVITC